MAKHGKVIAKSKNKNKMLACVKHLMENYNHSQKPSKTE
jgi:hypothetical protein